MARSSYALVLLASSTALAHVFPRQALASNVTTVVVPTQTSTSIPGPIIVTLQPDTSSGSQTNSAHTERTITSLDIPTSTHDEDTVTTGLPPKTVHSEKTQTSFDRPPGPSGVTFTQPVTARTQITQTSLDHPVVPTISWITWDTSIQITLPLPHTENSRGTLDGPGSTKATAPKAVTQVPGATLDVPAGPTTTMNQPGMAIPIEKPGQSNDTPRPGGASGKPDDGDGQSSPGGSEGQPGNGSPEGNQGAQGTQAHNNAKPTGGGVGGLISAIQSVATKQAEAPPGDKPSVTGFIVGTQTASPGGAAFTHGGSTFSALPSGAGLQVIANGKTETVLDASTTSLPVVQAGGNNGEYVLEGHTLTVNGQAWTSGGAKFSALPDARGVLVVSNGHTSTILLGEAIGANTSGKDSSHPTPVLLPGKSEQLITVGDKTYTAHITAGSLLVLGSQTIRPGFTTVINGETLLLTGSNLVLATGTGTSTRGLGGSIMSGLDGESESGDWQKSSTASETSESSVTAAIAEPSSGAGRRSLSEMRVLFSGASEDIELSSQTQGVIPPVLQGASEDIERSTQAQVEEDIPPAYQA
ncbi:hypothetical protein MBLNU13_g08884t1 [Cladosporium sp. NU13]